MSTRVHAGIAFIATGLLAACSSDNDVESVFLTGGFPNQSIGGIWEGKDTAGLQVFGIATEAGEFQFVSEDGVQFSGTATVTAARVAAPLTITTELGSTFGDGSTYGTGTLSGDVRTRELLLLDAIATTANGVAGATRLDLVFNSAYNNPSSLAIIAGTYTNTFSGAALTIDSTGAIFSQDPGTGCVLTGTVTIVNALYNAYSVEYSYASCTGSSAPLNGADFTGVATLDILTAPEQLTVAASANDGTAGLGQFLILDQT